MSEEYRRSGDSIVDVELGSGDDRHTIAGFAILALAQLCSIFGIWFGFWPAAFGMASVTGSGLSSFFVVSGLVGFYLSFRTLSTVHGASN